MSDQEFLDLLQAEVKRLTDLNRCHQQEILMLQRQLEDFAKENEKLRGYRPEPPPPASRRRGNVY